MKRRTFLQSVLGVLVAPCLPKSKEGLTAAEIRKIVATINRLTKYDQTGTNFVVRGFVYETTTVNPSKATEPKWRRHERLQPSTEPLFEDLDPYPPKFKKVEGISR